MCAQGEQDGDVFTDILISLLVVGTFLVGVVYVVVKLLREMWIASQGPPTIRVHLPKVPIPQRHKTNPVQNNLISATVDARIKNMRPRIIRLLALLWLGWYLAGPVCEAVDTWDSPQEELQDVIFHAGGALTVVAAAFCAGRVLSRRFRQLREVLAQRARIHLVAILALKPQAFVPVASLLADNSPPLPLRI
jgi:hypothetical protein